MRTAAVRLLVVAGLAAGCGGESVDPTGHWVGTLGSESDTVSVVLDVVRTSAGAWLGETDIPAQGIENYPVVLECVGDSVRVMIGRRDESPEVRGVISGDPPVLAGSLWQAGSRIPVRLARLGETRASRELLAMAGDDLPGTAVTTLTGDFGPLRDAFNQGVDHTRLLLLLSPS